MPLPIVYNTFIQIYTKKAFTKNGNREKNAYVRIHNSRGLEDKPTQMTHNISLAIIIKYFSPSPFLTSC
jgi:hypothetical protein